MKFTKLQADAPCDCVSKLSPPDSDGCFVRDFQRSDIPKRWFNSYWEDGTRERPHEKGNARAICLLKGVSLTACPSLEIVMAYRASRGYSPNIRKKRSHYCMLRFRDGSGKIEVSRTLHHNFFKSDEFSILEHLDVVAIGEYGDVTA